MAIITNITNTVHNIINSLRKENQVLKLQKNCTEAVNIQQAWALAD